MSNKIDITKSIKEKARELGFDECGISKAEFLNNQEDNIKEWISYKKNDNLIHYIEKNLDRRLDPTKLFDGAKSVVSLLKNYYPPVKQNGKYRIAKYAYGKDYHDVIKDKLLKLAEFLRSIAGECRTRAFVDTAPLLEKAWAVKSGLGQIGKNTLLINKERGSFFFLAEIVTDMELEYADNLPEDICGNCNRCIKACPTQALYAPYKLDPSKCISAITIEEKELVPPKYKGKLKGWIYGCDICQDVCPYNNNPKPHNELLFMPKMDMLDKSDDEWEKLKEKDFRAVFKGSAIGRIRYEKFMNNIFMNMD